MVKHLMKRQNILHDEKGFILCQSLNANQLGGPGVCSPGKISNLEVLKLPESCNFQSIFAYSEFSRRATILHEKRHFARAFQKGGEYVLPVPSGSYVYYWSLDLPITIATMEFHLVKSLSHSETKTICPLLHTTISIDRWAPNRLSSAQSMDPKIFLHKTRPSSAEKLT